MEKPHHHQTQVFHRLFSSSCRFNSINDVVENSIVSQNIKNIQPTRSKHSTSAKQSYVSNSALFSSKNGDEIDYCFTPSSDTSRSSLRNIGNIRPKVGFSNFRKGDITSSSEASTSSSVNSYNPLGKDEIPRQRITLAEQFRNQNFHYKNGKTERQGFDSSVLVRKTGQTVYSSVDSSVSDQKRGKMRRKTRVSERKCSSSTDSCLESGKVHRNGTESGLETRELQQISAKQILLLIGGSIEESYAVEKESRDPYEDFVKSMVEMIVEKKIKGVLDLEKLLICFLTLNSSVYHRIILDAFSEICEALFGT